MTAILAYLDCAPESGISDEYSLDVTGTVDTVNGTFCNADNSLLIGNPRNMYLTCDIIDHPDLKSCKASEGDHQVTFLSYLAVRVAYQWSINIVFGVFDGASLRLAHQHESDYSAVVVWTQILSAFGTLVPGLVVQDAEEGSGGTTYIDQGNDPKCLKNVPFLTEATDYSVVFYIQDICLALSIAVTFFLDIRMDKSGEKTIDALKKVGSKPALVYFFQILLFGIMWGVHDTFLLAFWSEDLGASSSLISNC